MKKIVLFLALGLFIGNAAFAQTKFGYIDSRELLSAMPEVKKADTDVEAYAKTFEDQLKAMTKEYETKIKDYQAAEKTMSEAVKEVKQKEIMDLQNRIETFNASAQEKIAAKKSEMYKPLLDKADKAIKDVATEKKYDYIFDAASGALLHANETDNILPLVKIKLGIK